MTQIFMNIGIGAVIVFAMLLVPVVMILLRPERQALAEAETRIAAAARGETTEGSERRSSADRGLCRCRGGLRCDRAYPA